MAKDGKLPYMKWYPADLDAEPTLRLCSWEAGFLWVKLLGFMHHSPQRGFLIKENGDAYSEKDLVLSISGATPEKIVSCLFELESNAVFSRDRRGIIYCRKMVKGQKRIKNLTTKKTKTGDKSEINQSKNGDKPDLDPPASSGNIKENSSSGDRSVVKPEARSQNLEAKEDTKVSSTAKKTEMKKAVAVGKRISGITGWDKDPRWFGDYSRCHAWLSAEWDIELDIIPTVQNVMFKRGNKPPPKTLKYFENAIADAYAYRTSPTPKGNAQNGTRKKTRTDDLAGQAHGLLEKYGNPEPN